jgi:hypothetical protein
MQRETANRRAMLGRLATGATVVALPATALAADAPDPHPAWYAEWKANLDWCNAPDSTGGRDLVEFPQWQRVLELEELIGTTPATTLAGAVAQLKVLHHWCAESLPGDDMEAALENALATVEQLAGGQAHG